MKKNTLFFCILLLCLSQTSVLARDMNEAELNYGIFVGANYNEMTGLQEMIVSEDYFTGYNFDSRNSFGVIGGVFLNYRASNLFGFQPEITFSTQHGKLRYSDIDDFRYDLAFKYNYMNVGIGFKLYPWENLFVSATPQVGFNITPNNLFYTSNGEDIYGPDLETQQLMRTAIKGKSNVSIGLGLGYQFLNRIYIEARYYFGVSDMIETLPNSYRFIENTNIANTVQFTIGYTILPIDL